MTAATTEATAQSEKAKGASPVIRGVVKTDAGWQDGVVLWKTSDEATAQLKGFIMDGNKKVNVLGFINENTEKKTKYIALKERAESGLKEVCFGNPINSSKNDEPVYFDTIAFNIGDQAIFGRITNAVTDELHAELGFTQPRIKRPAHEEAEEAAPAAAADRPRN